MTRRTFWIIFIVGIALRTYFLNIPPLWYDENFTLLLARSSFSAMLKATAGDVHPPLWYIIEWTLFHVAPSAPAWVIRVPALLFSIGTLPLFAWIMSEMRIHPKVQIAAFVMMAVMPFQLWYAQEGRMYAMLEFLVLLALIAAFKRNHVILFAAAVCLLYTQNYGPFYLVAIGLVIMLECWHDTRTQARALMLFHNHSMQSAKKIAVQDFIGITNASISPIMTAFAAWLPWMLTVTRQMNDISGRYWIMDKSAGAILIVLYKLFLTAAVPSEFFFASYLVTFGAVILGVIAIIRSKHSARFVVAIMAFVPLLIAWTVSLIWQPILLFRPLIGISPFLYLVVAWSFEDAKGENP